MWECETQRVNETAAAALASAEEMKDLKGNALSPLPPPPRVLVTWYGGVRLMWVWIIKGG